jgi:glycosyltransferase involved in cell wall biosynthesis
MVAGGGRTLSQAAVDPGGSSAGLPMVLHTRCITGTGGGPDKTILNSPRFLPALGYQAVCAFLHPPHDPGFAIVEQRAREASARVAGIPDRGLADLGVIRRLLQLCREHQVRIWHGHDYKTNVLGLIVRRFWPMHLVTTAHGWVQYTPRLRLYYAIDRWALRRYDQVVCVSEDLHQACLDLGLSPSRCHLVHNAIDVQRYRREVDRSVAKQQLGAPGDRVLLGAVGRLSQEKGFDVLIRAAAELLRRGRPITLWIAGDGPARRELEQLIKELGVEAHVRLLGFVQDLRMHYQAMDVYVLSSVREGLPNSLLEAMALEAPVLATRIAGIPSLIADNVNGLLVEPGSVGTLVDGLQRLLEDEGLRDRLGREARSTIVSYYSFERRMQRIAAVYDRVMASRPGNAVVS